MDQNPDRTDRRTRRDVRDDRRTPARPVQGGEKDFFDPDNPADRREYLVVLSYGRR